MSVAGYTGGLVYNCPSLSGTFLALTRDYGFDYIDAKTPMPVKYEYGEGEVIVSFNVGVLSLKPRSVDLDGFEMAGEDGVFYPAFL